MAAKDCSYDFGLPHITCPSLSHHTSHACRLLFTPVYRIRRIWFASFFLTCSRKRLAYERFGFVTTAPLYSARNVMSFCVLVLSSRLVTQFVKCCGGSWRRLRRLTRAFDGTQMYLTSAYLFVYLLIFFSVLAILYTILYTAQNSKINSLNQRPCLIDQSLNDWVSDGKWMFHSQKEVGIFLLATMSRPALGPTLSNFGRLKV
jgi:hypothetical protein